MRTLEAWRVLGLPSTPTVEAVKQAYRGLAKSLHPDAAGGTAKPAAFARLTEAYEVALSEASAANRHGATRSRQSSPPPPRQRSAPRRDAAPRDPEARGARPRATPGSTTYDGAGPEDGDQPWDGAEWVGADSGTYWRVNPKEYADPRKHGAEYRARGKRPVRRDRSEQRVSPTEAAYVTEEERGLAPVRWPSTVWRLFYALAGWLPWLALPMSPLAIGVELLLLGLFLQEWLWRGQTLGKRIFILRTVDHATQATPTFMACLLRSFWKAAFVTLYNPLTIVIGLINFHVPLFRYDRRSWHDMLSRTYVIDAKQNRTQQG